MRRLEFLIIWCLSGIGLMLGVFLVANHGELTESALRTMTGVAVGMVIVVGVEVWNELNSYR